MTLYYFSGLYIAFLCSTGLTYFFLKYDYLQSDVPNNRSMHKVVTPRGGGLAIVVSIVIVFLGITFFSENHNDYLWWCIFPILGIATLGWMDDRQGQPIRRRLIIQFLVAIGVVFFILTQSTGYENYTFLFFSVLFLLSIGLVWYMNLYNFMDGLDGLAATQSTIVCFTFSFWFYLSDAYSLSLLCGLTAASSLGFLVFNWSPAKVFMGDVGSVTLGFLIGVSTLHATLISDIPLLASLAIMSVFLFDSTYTLLRRMVTGQKWWQAHRTHLYQYAADFLEHRLIVLLILFFNIGISLVATWYVIRGELGILLILLVLFALFSATLFIQKKTITRVNSND